MSRTDLPDLSPELEALFAAEAPIPTASEALRTTVAGRLAITLGFGPSGGGGGFGVAAIAATLALVIGAGGLGYFALAKKEALEPPAESVGKGRAKDRIDETASEGARSTTLPSWFGEPSRPERRIGGRVFLSGKPVGGATVALTSALTYAGVASSLTLTTDGDGRFEFGPQRAAEYDVTASLAANGFGTASVDSRDPRASLELTIELSGCPHHLSGTVSDASGGVVIGASLWWTRGRWSDLRSLLAGATSGDDGRYELCLPAGFSMINVAAVGFGAVAISETLFGDRERDITLLPEASVRGRVETESGESIAGIQVALGPTRWVGPSRTSIEHTVSDASGRFRFEGIAPGRHQVGLDDRERASDIVPVTVEAGGESDEIVLVARARPVISARVLEAGRAVPGARVSAREARRRPSSGWLVADENGRVEISLARPALVEFRVEGYEVISPAEHSALAERTTVDIHVAAAAKVSGVVLTRGAPVSGAEVIAVNLDRSRRDDATTDSHGRFEIALLEPGRHELSAKSERLGAFTGESRLTIDVRRGQHREDIELHLDGAGSISGIVVDGEGNPLADVFVQYDRDQGDDLCTARTDRRGAFVCPMLAGFGAYRATVKPAAGSALVLPPSSVHPLVEMNGSADVVTGQRLEVTATRAAISGRVVGDGGGPRPDVTVQASETQMAFDPRNAPVRGYATATSDDGGNFSIGVWSGTDYQLLATSPSGGRGHIVARAGDRSVTLILIEAGRVSGRLVGFSATPEIALRRVGNNNDIFGGRVDGNRFEFDAVPPGDYAILARAGSDGAAQPIRVGSGASVSAVVTARGTTRLRGRVLDFDSGGAVAGVHCMVSAYLKAAGVAGWGSDIAPSAPDGSFETDAPLGPIEVYCFGRDVNHSEGAARLVAGERGRAEVDVLVVVSETVAHRANGIGARFLFENEETRIAQLRPAGPAIAVGLRVGDVVATVEGRDVSMLTDAALARYLGTFEIGTTIKIGVRRDAKELNRSVAIEGPWQN